MSERMVRISLRLSPEESQKLKRSAASCGLSQTEYLRQLCNGNVPKVQPKKAFWKLLDELYQLHETLKKSVDSTPDAAESCRIIERLIVNLQAECTQPESISQ